MKVNITYQVKSGEVRQKWFIKDSIAEALQFFKWRYGHTVVSALEA